MAPLPFIRRAAILACLPVVHLALPLAAQVPPPPPNLSSPLVLPPGPAISDWQPRGRAVPGMRIVLTGTQLRPADFRAVIGSTKYPLPVRLQSSSATRIVLEVPDGALGKQGELVVSHTGTRGTLLESAYRIDPPNPQMQIAPASWTSFMPFSFTLRVSEFPGASVRPGDVTINSPCRFRSSPNVQYGEVGRDSAMQVRLSIRGIFRQTGNCAVDVTFRPLSAAGTALPSFTLSGTTVGGPRATTVIENTADLQPLLNAAVSRSGLANVCQANRGDWPGGEPVGVHTNSGDIEWVIRGNVNDVICEFRTTEWLFNHGVRLARVVFSTRKVGDRCGPSSSYTNSELISFSMTRGTVIIRPEAGQDAAAMMVEGDDELRTSDGVIYGPRLVEWRSMWLPMFLALTCKSMALPLQTAAGMSGPTTSPQSYTVRLERVELSHAGGESLGYILTRGFY